MLAHNVDATVVGSVEFEDLLAHVFGAVDLAREGEDGGGFAGAGRAVEEEVRETVGADEAVDGLEDVFVAGDVVEGVWSVFLDP